MSPSFPLYKPLTII
jgi:serine/threonine-protein phosphatase 2A regulatory subunit B